MKMEWEREKEQINEEYGYTYDDGFDPQKELERIQEELEDEFRLSSIYAETDSVCTEV